VFEFHGWISVWTRDPNGGSYDDLPAKMEDCLRTIRSRLADERYEGSWFEIRETVNEQIVLVMHGLRNHRRGEVFDLFKWVGERYPFSYGLLFTTDDEDMERENEFTTYRLAHGKVAEVRDSLLSPIIPTVRNSYPWD
jgi:hypothetical protein